MFRLAYFTQGCPRQSAHIDENRSHEEGNFGDAEPVGDGLSEARIHYGPGYRVYFMQQGDQIVVLLCGGDKSTQPKDIKLARKIASGWKEANHG
ncbi:type II toxin-antitoxin system RelE/ParE family toxin [Pantoea stewartii]